ncbi:MAG: hypothetical protein LJE68_16405 [Rhodobacter sp.]|nr:hypothetical protein [Rhodobacter sp.]
MTNTSRSLSHWKANHSLVTIIGIILNLCLAVPLLLWPGWILTLFGIPVANLIWPRFAGGLLIILSVFYAPIILDLNRFRILAWFQIFPSRMFGALFFLGAVVIFGAPAGFLVGTLIDGSIAILALFCLIRVVGLEQDIATGRADT